MHGWVGSSSGEYSTRALAVAVVSCRGRSRVTLGSGIYGCTSELKGGEDVADILVISKRVAVDEGHVQRRRCLVDGVVRVKVPSSHM